MEDKTVGFEDDIDFKHIIRSLWKRKLLISSFVILSSLVSLFYALSLPNIYRSEVTLAPSQNEMNMPDLGGFASFAGIEFDSQRDSKKKEALTVIRSLNFFESILLPFISLEDLMATKSWDPLSNEIIYDSDKYELESKTWVRKVDFPFKTTPTAQEAHLFFNENVFFIGEERDTGFVTLSVEHQSPYFAKELLEYMVTSINRFFREKDKDANRKSIEYLKKEMSETKLSPIKDSISELISKEISLSVLIEVDDEYVFKILNPPIAPEFKYKPKRSVICLIGFTIGLLLGFISALLLEFNFPNIRKIS